MAKANLLRQKQIGKGNSQLVKVESKFVTAKANCTLRKCQTADEHQKSFRTKAKLDFDRKSTVAHKCNTQNKNLEHRNKTWNRKKLGTEKKTWNRKKKLGTEIKFGTETRTWTAGSQVKLFPALLYARDVYFISNPRHHRTRTSCFANFVVRGCRKSTNFVPGVG